MSKVSVACPKCQKAYAIDKANLGRKGKCNKCNTTFVLTRTVDSTLGGVSTSVTPRASDRQFLSAENVPVEWNSGDLILDLYEVKGVLGQGGMGTVYQVHHRTWNINLAVKCPLPSYFRTNQQKENFTRECQTWIDLGLHPNIVSCYYVRTLGGIPRVFAECVEGGSLKEWIDSGKLYEGGHDAALKRILDISIQFAWGLDYAHEKQLIHQDVKPANVLLTHDGTVKVSDFGLANARVAAGETILALGGREQSILASYGGKTPAYCSPEQDNQEKLTRRTDLWSWAVSVLEMFTGEVTWHGGSVAGAALEVYLENGSNDNRIPQMTTSIAELLRHCFQIEPEARPRTMAEVGDRLVAIYEQVVGTKYNRQRPRAVELTADSLNNQAVSLLDLGQAEQAEKLWDQALERHPGHLQATYNRGLLLWRTARLTDDVLLRQMTEARQSDPNNWEGAYLTGQIHLERWSVDDATKEFERAVSMGGGDVARFALDVSHKLLPREPRCLREFRGNTTSLALNADGRYALTGGRDSNLRLWDVSTGRCLRTLQGHSGPVTSVALSVDGRYALSASKAESPWLWDVNTGKCLRIFEGCSDEISTLVFCSDSRHALFGSSDCTVGQWEVATGKCVRTLRERDACGIVYALSSDGCHEVWGGFDTVFYLRDLSTDRDVRTFRGYNAPISSAAVCASNSHAVSISSGDTWRLWDSSTGRCLRTFPANYGRSSAALNADGRYALVSDTGDVAQLWELNLSNWNCSESRAVSAFCRAVPINVAAQATVAHELALTDARRATRNAKYGEALQHVRTAQRIPGYERSAAATEILVALIPHLVRTTFKAGWQVRSFQEPTSSVTSVALSADGRFALSGSYDNMRLWEVSTGQCLRVFKGYVNSVSLTADGRHALSGSIDKKLRLWDVSTGKCVRTFQGHTGSVDSVVLSADGSVALSGSRDTTLRLWKVSTGECLRTFLGHERPVQCVALSSDGCLALSGCGYLDQHEDNSLRLWNVATGRCLRRFQGANHMATAVAFSIDGRHAISSGSWQVMLWEVSTGQCLRVFQGHTSSVKSVALSADSRYALSGSMDKTLRLWEVSTGRCLRVFQGHSDSVTSLALSSNCTQVVSGSDDRTLRLWALDWEYEYEASKRSLSSKRSLFSKMFSARSKK